MGTIDDWNQYWKENPDSKVLFTGDDGKSILDFEHFWSKNLPNETEMQSVIDIACGAGALFQIFGDKRFHRKVGLDCSVDALNSLKKNVPDAQVILNKASQLPKEKLIEFDLIVSQFGIEYLGAEAIKNMPTMMKEGSRFIALCHYKNGHIYSRYNREKEGMESLFEIHAFENALQIADLIVTDPNVYENRAKQYLSHLSTLDNKWCAGSLHFVNGIKQLFLAYKHYEHSDILAWIKGFEQQLETIYRRVSAICDVALSTSDIKQITNGKYSDSWVVRPFLLKNKNLPVAWDLRFKKE
mgnify:FL=1